MEDSDADLDGAETKRRAWELSSRRGNQISRQRWRNMPLPIFRGGLKSTREVGQRLGNHSQSCEREMRQSLVRDDRKRELLVLLYFT